MDFANEARNYARFRSSLADLPWVRVPRVLASGPDHLVLEYVPSRKPDGSQRSPQMAAKLMVCVATQVLRNGLVHADLHAGNVGLGDGGSLVFYDLGAMLDVSALRGNMLGLVRAAAVGDVDALIDTLTDMGVIARAGCTPGSRRKLRKLFASTLSYMTCMQAGEFSMEDQAFLMHNDRQVVRLEATYVYLTRTLSMAEGVARSLDPDFTYDKYLEQLLPALESSDGDANLFAEAGQMLKSMAQLPAAVKSSHAQADELAEQLDALQAHVDRLTKGLAVAVAAALVAAHL